MAAYASVIFLGDQQGVCEYLALFFETLPIHDTISVLLELPVHIPPGLWVIISAAR
jgi:hypothetical protein